jgi:hypothetical protein
VLFYYRKQHNARWDSFKSIGKALLRLE